MHRQVSPALVALSWIFSAAVYSRLPGRIATHYDLAGMPDRWDPKIVGAFIIPVLMLITLLAARWQPQRGEPRMNDQSFLALRELVLTSLLAFLALMHVGLIGAALDWRVSVPQLLPLGLGALFLVFGHVLPRLQRSGLVGIRTRSTLASEQAWVRTHRVVGAIMTAGGTIMIGAALFDAGRAMMIAVGAAVLSAVATLGYVYQTRA